jgi:mannose/fructose/N-acetylgalactosamine-specific phosphotransferase system component IID
MHYALHDLKYSPQQLEEFYNAKTPLKAFIYASIDVALEQKAKKIKEIEKLSNKEGR